MTNIFGSSFFRKTGFSGYQIDQSAVFDGSTDYLSRTLSTPTDAKIWTISCWLKMCDVSTTIQTLMCSAGGGAQTHLGWNAPGNYQFGLAYGGYYRCVTTKLWRDPGSWGHLVIIFDSTEAVAADRCRMIWNGVALETTQPTAIGLNDTTLINTAVAHNIGDQSGQPNYEFDGYFAEFHFIDGTAYDATDFGEFYNGTTAWRPIQPSGLTYGTNGFHLDFATPSTATPLSNGVTPTSSETTYSGNLSDLTDGNLGDEWTSPTDPHSSISNATFDFDLTTAQAVNVVSITGRNNDTCNYKVSYSDNGSDWTDTGTTFSNVVVTTAEDSGVLDFTSDVAGSHRYWRLTVISSSAGTSRFGYAEIRLHSSAGALYGLGADASGQVNHWTENGSPVQSGDSPTVNYATLNVLAGNRSFSNGNRTWTSTAVGVAPATMECSPNSGNWYAEINIDAVSSGAMVGVVDASFYYRSSNTRYPGDTGETDQLSLGYWHSNGNKYVNGINSAYGATYTTGDVIGILINTDDGEVTFYKNNISQGAISYDNTRGVMFACGYADNSGSGVQTIVFDENDWTYSAPSDAKALSAANLPEATITDGSKHFETTTWTGYTSTLYEQTRISSSTTINNSVVLDSGSSQYLNQTFSAGNQKTWTLSFWIKNCVKDDRNHVFTAYTNSTNYALVSVGADGFAFSDYKLGFYVTVANSAVLAFLTNSLHRDPGGWSHCVIQLDTTQATSTDRVKIWCNGVQLSDFATAIYPSLNADVGLFNTAMTHRIGTIDASLYGYLDGYLSEMHFCDGQAYEATDFGEFNSDNIWSPKAVSGLTYGTNGFFLPFTQDTPNLGVDYSGNGNDWTENGSPTQSSDSPTVNYCTWNAVKPTIHTLTDGNRTIDAGAAYYQHSGTIGIEPGEDKYFEIEWNGYTGASSYGYFGVCTEDIVSETSTTEHLPGTYGCNNRGTKNDDGTLTTSHFSWSTFPDGTVIGFHVDRINNLLKVYLNGVYESGKDITLPSYGMLFPWAQIYSPVDLTIDCGQAGFQHTPPSGTTEISSANLPAISDSDLYFNGGSADLVWIKSRSATTSHKLIDTVRGVGLNMSSDSTAAETGEATVNRIDKYGIHLGDDADVNNAAATYVAWNWKAGGAGVVNTDGTISSTVSVNDDAGFSIVSWTLGSTDNQTVGHGLSAAPEFMFLKNRDAVGGWTTYHKDNTSAPETDYLNLHSTAATTDSALPWNDTAPTNSVFTIGDVSWFGSASDEMIMYCFRSIPGYSKVFSYTGNGSADGPFVYCGFRPRYILGKRSSTASQTYGWWIIDTERDPVNFAAQDILWADTNAAEAANTYSVDRLCNGFKHRSSNINLNASSNIYVGIAFAENPFGGSNLPLGLAQ